MRTYFIRHTKGLNVDENTLRSLWNNDYIAIHFPCPDPNQKYESDSESVNPNDYKKTSAKQAIGTFKTIEEKGGYICAEYRYYENYKIGFVSPDSKITIFPGKWGNKNREAKLKVIKLSCVKEITPQKAILFNNSIPRMGTVKGWNSCRDIIKKNGQGREN